ncbi:hypothetical protein BT96DRAFT_721686 [Gymnopus androsaceus JB14]|uniref:Uncharacterized protein n=1 Tax=Gymnopus androsaceus JB14 TaxID=1447944 RepID=A0A6A4HIM9_9AGAR|nr:hypothetical protein BT96DRAFT_721686 [Gymnopus androsaceus JB14]
MIYILCFPPQIYIYFAKTCHSNSRFFGNRFDLPLPKVGFKGHTPINAGIGGVLAVISLPSLVGIVPPLAVSLLPAPSMSFRYSSRLV